ncbi:MAG: hypothetical protein AB7E47_01755 [Desulfovibrionaceae bacterium]
MKRHELERWLLEEDDKARQALVEDIFRDALDEPSAEVTEEEVLREIFFNGALAAAGLMREEDFCYEE